MTGQLIPDSALTAWRALSAALRATGPAPCETATSIEAWWSTDPATVGQARAACEGCPVRAECLAYALAADERTGVWGGVDETRRARRARESAAPVSQLRALRLARGLKLGELAAAVGISYPYLSNIERGRRPLTDAVLPRIADALEVSQSVLTEVA